MNKLFSAAFTSIAVVITVLLVVMLATMSGLAFTRYVFAWSPSWTEEITRYCMIWIVMLGGAVLVYFDDHIALYFSFGNLTSRGKTVQRLFVRAVMLVTSALVAWTGFKFSFSQANYTTAGSGISMLIPTISVPISAVLMFIITIYRSWIDLLKLGGKDFPEDIAQSKYMHGSFAAVEEEHSPL